MVLREEDRPPPIQDCDHPRLASALAAPQAGTAEGLRYRSLEEQAAVLFYHVIKNHPHPTTGNKRLAVVLVGAFLYENGYALSPAARIARVARQVAASSAEERAVVLGELTNWIHRHLISLEEARGMTKERGQMRLDWMMLANHAEVRDGLLMMIGGSWDTINVVEEPPLGQPAAVVRGMLVARLLANRSEGGREYPFEIRVMDADGGLVAQAQGAVTTTIGDDLPRGWDQGNLLVVDLTGLPLPAIGFYEVSLFVNDNLLGTLAFRVKAADHPPSGFSPLLPT